MHAPQVLCITTLIFFLIIQGFVGEMELVIYTYFSVEFTWRQRWDMQIYKLCGADCQVATSFSSLAGIRHRGRNTATAICNPSADPEPVQKMSVCTLLTTLIF